MNVRWRALPSSLSLFCNSFHVVCLQSCYIFTINSTFTFFNEFISSFSCNEELMMKNLVENGPIAVSFMVYGDFMHYKGGIYQHTTLTNGFNPFEITNHVVLVVGYGYDSDIGHKYWLVKNSWGTKWGEDGFFRIMRGVDECSIESIAVQSFPIL